MDSGLYSLRKSTHEGNLAYYDCDERSYIRNAKYKDSYLISRLTIKKNAVYPVVDIK